MYMYMYVCIYIYIYIYIYTMFVSSYYHVCVRSVRSGGARRCGLLAANKHSHMLMYADVC